ncbi:MAG: hypothetical protein WD599_07475, partial [Balneolaceae bacterium]
REYPKAQRLAGGKLHNFPVILNPYNDLSNGFVTPINFRTEIEVPPIKGKSMNPRSGDWLELVLPHELVHALHLNVNPSSISSLTGLFSPDFRRSIHGAAPLGIFEGIAVEYESHQLHKGGGRGNYPYFTQQFHSNFNSDRRWAMGQLVHISTSTLPYNRHYIGGYTFIHWLLDKYGEDTFRNATGFHYKWPFLGFGTALRKTTGEWPSELYQRFEEDTENQQSRSSEHKALTRKERSSLSFWQKGPVFRRPLWLDENTLLLHGKFYNSATGFYTYDLTENHLRLLHESRSVEDYRFSYQPETHSLYFSDYVADPIYNHTFKADLFRYNLETGKRSRLTRNQRVYAPVPGDPVLALQTDGSRSKIVTVNQETGEVSSFYTPGEDASIVEMLHHTEIPDLSAVIQKKQTNQSLWIIEDGKFHETLSEKPAVSFKEGSVFDLAWHPEDQKLLFTSDHTGVMNIYELDMDSDSLLQITRSLFNAFEGSYSPNGERIAYVIQEKSKFIPVVLERQNFLNRAIPESRWKSISPIEETIISNGPANSELQSEPDSNPDEWTQKPYKPGLNWLFPRTFIPHYEQIEDNVYELGLRFMSTEPLSTHSYDMTVTGVQNRVWFDINYMNKDFYPGYELNLFNSPSFPSIRDQDDLLEVPVRFLLQERGASLTVPFRFVFERNTRLTALSILPKYKLFQTRFYGLNDPYEELNDYGVIHTGIISMVFNYRLRQYSRDFQPNSGWIFTSQFDMDLNDHPFEFNHENYSFKGTFRERKGLRIGTYKFLAPLARWNQSLRLGTQILVQSRFPKFSTQNIVSDAFSGSVFRRSNNLITLGSRYTIPIAYPDQGGLTIPAYLSNIYVVLFSQTVGNLNMNSFSDIVSTSRTAIGAGIRTRVRLSNFNFDLGIGFGYEPSRDHWSLIVSPF